MVAKIHGLAGNHLKGVKPASIYKIWANIKQRCHNPDNPRYKDYGGRGITMCERWHTFEHFYADVGDRPDGLSLDRIDNNKGYEPGNVRWTNADTQNKNSRRATMLTYNGKTQCINDWCREIGIAYVTYKRRIRMGWTQINAATTPADKRNRPN